MNVNLNNLNQEFEDFFNIVKALQLTPDTERIFWKELLTYLHNLTQPESSLILDSNTDKLVNFISNYCDIEDISEKNCSILYESLSKKTMDDPYWNESLQQLIIYTLEKLSNDDDLVLLPIDKNNKHSITIGTLKNADAGNSFNNGQNEKYVIPWWNIDDKTYNEIRKHDQTINALNRNNKLQFTHSDISNWIRLIMPQYARRVEIEDLDRNFWVISQTIAAISNYLFGNDNPLFNILKGELREITELWENILYLWLESALITQNKNNKVRMIVCQLPVDNYNYSYKYDNCAQNITITGSGQNISIKYKNQLFSEETIKREIISKLEYLTHQYNNQSLCIIPIIKANNYYYNYYSVEYYPYVIYYHHSHNFNQIERYPQWKVIEIKNGNDQIIISPQEQYDQHNFGEKISAMRQDKLSYSYTYPYRSQNLDEMTFSKNSIRLYGALRTIISGTNELFNDNIESSLTFDVYDASAQRITGIKRKIGSYKFKLNNEDKYILSFEDNANLNQNQFDNFIQQGEYNFRKVVSQSYKDKIEPNFQHSVYYGEVASYPMTIYRESQVQTITNFEAETLKIGSFLPTDAKKFAISTTGDENNVYYTSMRNNITCINGSSSTVQFYWYDWDKYQLEKDDEGQSVEHIYQLSAKANTEINTNRLYKDTDEKGKVFSEENCKEAGFNAVKNFVEKAEIKIPYLFCTACGLTPWNGGINGNIIYWDVGGINHLYFYIPTQTRFEQGINKGKNDIVYNYEDFYNKWKNTCDSDEDKKEDENNGLIICLGQISKYDSFYDNYGYSGILNEKKVIYTSKKWRQFRVIADAETNFCKKITVTDNEGQEFSIYKIDTNIADGFKFLVEYYDNRYRLNNNKDWNDISAQVGKANVYINNNKKYQQYGIGYISPADDTKKDITIRENYALNSGDSENPKYRTGFIDYSNSGFYNVQTGNKAGYYNGYTPLYGAKECTYQVRKD